MAALTRRQLPDRLLSRKETAELLGISQCTLWRIVERGDLPSIRVGDRRVLFDPADVRAYLDRLRIDQRDR